MHIRIAAADDAGPVRAIYAPIVESTAISFELVVPSEEELEDWAAPYTRHCSRS